MILDTSLALKEEEEMQGVLDVYVIQHFLMEKGVV